MLCHCYWWTDARLLFCTSLFAWSGLGSTLGAIISDPCTLPLIAFSIIFHYEVS